MKRALVIGIDDYSGAPLKGCVNDAIEMGSVLQTVGNGDPNFSVRALTSQDGEVTSAAMHEAIEKLFEGDAQTVVLYFAGHGIINRETNTGFIVSQDGKKGAWGMSLVEILSLANRAYPKIKSSVIMLDSCNSGFLGEIAALGGDAPSLIGTGVTILTASHREGVATEGHEPWNIHADRSRRAAGSRIRHSGQHHARRDLLACRPDPWSVGWPETHLQGKRRQLHHAPTGRAQNPERVPPQAS
ncbi:caspase family protein [Komagataeibacter nataicola]|uniref:caspase family protein n=1 Tax=Komagataeibacter nataicola TaxID=265960 RepID=UPI0028A5AAA6|nr:caspase family protein [Komagataeibacter nataicola]WNM07534.1 caspase family protein [Komagataeibacter nataicola]